MIRSDVPLFARTLLERSGGCSGSDAKTIAGNLAAIGTFGTLPHHSLPATLLEREATANGAGFLCVYPGDDKASRKLQGYRLPDPINLLRDSPWGSYWEAINRQIDEGRYGKDRGTRPDIPFIRNDCPLTPDPRYRISTEYTLPTVPQLSGSIAERMSTYFVDYYIPHLGMRETRTPLRLNPGDLQRLREEIIRIESIEVTRAEIEESIRQTDASDRARGQRPMNEPGTCDGLGWRAAFARKSTAPPMAACCSTSHAPRTACPTISSRGGRRTWRRSGRADDVDAVNASRG
jgi:hypothetical protein